MFFQRRYSVWSFYITTVFMSRSLVFCLNVSDTNRLYSQLLTDYNRKLLPLQNQSEIAEVNLSVHLISINSFDELSGELAFSAMFNITWSEERMSWSPQDFDGKTSLLIAPEDIWRPKIFVRESVDFLQELGNISDMLRLTHDGFVVWTIGSVLKVICSVDVTYFPFDTQTCTITLTTLTVRSDELKIYTLLPFANTMYWTPNSQWTYINSSVYSYVLPDGPSGIVIDIILRRRSEFFILYLLIPLIFLGKINNLVFFMPASAGERCSVAITSFLAFAVYMQIVNSSVPQSSAPIAYIYYYLMFLLLYSSIIMFACILSMRIYDKKGRVPSFLKNVVLVLRCRCCKRRKKSAKVTTVERSISTVENSKTELDNNNEITQIEENLPEEDEITWTLVGKTFDVYFGVLNILAFIGFTLSTIIMLYLNTGIPVPLP